MNIDQHAPLTAHEETFIAVTPEKVWGLLADINQWPDWQPDVTSAQWAGDLNVGAIFKWKAKGLTITSMLQEVEPGQRIGWTGNAFLMKAIHWWRFEPQGSGTHVTSEESLSGWFPRLLKIFDPAFLKKSLGGSLQILKRQAERQ